MSTRYEDFVEDAKTDMAAYQKKLSGDGTWEYVKQVEQLEKLGINMNTRLLVYLFGDHLGEHLGEKFFQDSRGNLLHFLRGLTSEFRFFILYELKNNRALFANC